MAEERRKKLAMLDSKRKRRNTEQTAITENLDELGNFLEKYCIIKKPDLTIYKNIFEKFDEDRDGFLWPEEVLEALENVNAKLLNDAHLRY
ncbi:Contactin-associated like 5-3, partial [Paramuricea clavata]